MRSLRLLIVNAHVGRGRLASGFDPVPAISLEHLGTP